MAPKPKIDADTIARASRRIAAGQSWRDAAADAGVSVGALHKRVTKHRLGNPEPLEIRKEGRSRPPATALAQPAEKSTDVLPVYPPEPTAPSEPQPVLPLRIESAKERRARLAAEHAVTTRPSPRPHPNGDREPTFSATGRFHIDRRRATDGTPAAYFDRYDARNPKGTEMRLRDHRGIEKGYGWFHPADALELRDVHGWEYVSGVTLPSPWDTPDILGNLTCPNCDGQFPSAGSLARHRDLHHVAAAAAAA